MKWLFFKLAFLYPRIYAFFCYYRKKGQRREFEEKVRLFFNETDPAKIKRVVRGIFELRGGRKIQRYVIPRIDSCFVKSFVKIDRLDLLDRALEERRGVVLISGHIGNPHIGFNILRMLGYGITIVKGGSPRAQRFPKWRYFDPYEYTIFTHDTFLGKPSKERILEVLRSGGMMYNVVDGMVGSRRVDVPFLGRTMSLPTGMLHIAYQVRAVVLPFIHLYQRGRIRLIFHEPIDGSWSQGVGDVKRIVAEMARLLESYFRSYPEECMGLYGYTVLDHFYRSHKKEDGPPESEQ